MVELNHRDRTIKVKLVYYGPPVGGKTTNLQILHRCADAKRRGELISINSAQDRTILFDLLPLKTPGFRGFDLRLQVLAVPGQAMYSATRRLVLKGADSLVFVANSALDRWEENIQSYREMTQNLISHHLDPEAMPLVFQYNKRDLPQMLDVEALDRALNRRRRRGDPGDRGAGRGRPRDLRGDPRAHGPGPGQPLRDPRREGRAPRPGSGRSRRSWSSSAGRASPATRRPRPPPGRCRRPSRHRGPASGSRPHGPRRPRDHRSGHTVVRVAPPPAPAEEAHRPAGPEAKASELVETYAEASAQLGAALTELREERDVARQRLDDLRQTMLAAQELLERHAARGRARARARPHGPHRGRRARRASGSPSPGSRRARRRSSGCETDPVLAVARRPAPRLGDSGPGCEAGLRLRRREPRPRPGARPAGEPLRGSARGALPHPGRAAGAGRLLLRPGHRAAGAGGARAPRRDPARARGRARARRHPQHREGGRARARARARRDRLAPRARAPGGVASRRCATGWGRSATGPTRRPGSPSSTSGSPRPSARPSTTAGRSWRSAAARSGGRPSTSRTCSPSCARPR